MTTTTPQAQPFTERPDFTPVHTPAPLREGRRGQIANLWLYAYCAILSPFILPLVYAAWRAVDTFWHRYELLPNRLRITTGLYRPHIHTEEVDFGHRAGRAGRGVSALSRRQSWGCRA